MRRSLRVWLVNCALLSCGGCFWLVVDDDLHDRGGRGGHGGDDRGASMAP